MFHLGVGKEEDGFHLGIGKEKDRVHLRVGKEGGGVHLGIGKEEDGVHLGIRTGSTSGKGSKKEELTWDFEGRRAEISGIPEISKILESSLCEEISKR